MNDGTQSAPYLRPDFNLYGVWDLPDGSSGPVDQDALTQHTMIKDAGYRGVQGGDTELCRTLGLGPTTYGRVNIPSEAAPLAAIAKRDGYQALTLHVGWGHEDDSTLDALVRAITRASNDEDLPIYIETHRATITQDSWRTVRLIERNPEIRFNADFSHWYTGLEMPYGDWEEKVAFLAPVFERVRFVHGRCGNSSHIQMPLHHPSMADALEHFRDLWTRSFAGFLRTARPGDFICFAPELLPPCTNYANTVSDGQGNWQEASDRWSESLQLIDLAQGCFAAAQANDSIPR